MAYSIPRTPINENREKRYHGFSNAEIVSLLSPKTLGPLTSYKLACRGKSKPILDGDWFNAHFCLSNTKKTYLMYVA